MGFGGRKPVLPAPTESIVSSGQEDLGYSTEIATDLSRRTDRTSATIPDDGSPVTISTGQKTKLTKSENQSQTSLLIEYYEGQKEPGSNRRPSLRVRVRPSTGKSKDKAEGYLDITRVQGTRKPSITQRIPLTSKALNTGVTSFDSDTSKRPVSALTDIDIEERGSDMSELSGSPEPRYIAAPSDISSMPPDSMLGTNSIVARAPLPATSSILSNSELETSDLKPPTFPRERNLSQERIIQKAMEKSSKERESSRSVQSGKSRSRSGSGTHESRHHERRRRPSKPYAEESSISGGTESILSNSVLSGVRSIDDKSVRSGASNITNPKLLQTVEDAIRRLILPELKEIKRNGSQRIRQEDSYSDSDNSIAREKASAKRTSSSHRRRVSKGSGSGRRRRHRDQDIDYDSPSESSHRRESISSMSTHERNDKRGRDGMISTGLTAAALQHQDSNSTLDRRRKSKSRSSRSASIAETEDTFEKHSVPPMPFRSEIGSEVTRSSLLSSNTAATTPTQREVREVIRGSPFGTPSTPTQDLKQTLGTHHRNFSGHDLGNRNSIETDDYTQDFHDSGFVASGLLADPERLKAYENNLHQQHPIRRGLSPIQSVASYATTEPNRHSAMQTRSIDSISSFKRRQQLKEEASMDSFISASHSMKDRNHQVDDFYNEQHDENEKYRSSIHDKVTSGKHVDEIYGSNPEYIHTQVVESAVASLIEPSVLSQQPQSPRQSTDRVHDVGYKSPSLKDVQSPNSLGKRAINSSPPQSPAHSFEESRQDVINVQNDISGTSPESEITTNPSVIQGPIGGLSGNTEHWPYAATPDPPVNVDAPDLIPEGLKLSQRAYEPEYSSGQLTPIGKDEGYATGDNPRSPGLYAKQNERFDLDDPFVTKRNKYMSGMSQGMSPIYDSATGRGIDRIQSKDIVALMDHLTVRDAQRNARDTEILVTLVRSAAEMRNSFEDIKKFIAEQDGLIMNTSEKQHEKTQRIIGGPRPQPVSIRKSVVSPEEDLPTKRRNIFKRALQGLGTKNAMELQNIEQMLVQLLDDVEDLKTLQIGQKEGSIESVRPPTDTGYEPEGEAGTSDSVRNEYRSNRVSTVIEEDYYDTNRIDRGTALGSHQYRQESPQLDETPVEPTSGRKKASSFLPKLMSRWSKTTTSTEPRFSTQKRYSQVSRSGSDLAEFSYEPQPEDRLDRPPSPLVPSQLSEPRYQGYRNSMNLEHPQPRQGPTGRYQNQLENEAQNYQDQSSQVSFRQPLSPISDTYSRDEPLVPQRPPKLPMSPNYVDHVNAARGSPAFDKSPLRSPEGSGRKPSGPRPYSIIGGQPKGDLNTVKKTRFRGSPFHIPSSDDVTYQPGV